MKKHDMIALQALAEMKRDVDLQELSQIGNQMNKIQIDINAIRNQARRRAESVELDLARLSGIDVQWESWVNQAVRKLQLRMAKLAVERAKHLEKARKSFGRADALRQLGKRGKKAR